MPILEVDSAIDIIEGSFVREIDGVIVEIHRLARIRVFEFFNPLTEDEVIFEALNDTGAVAFPQPGEVHPHDGSLILVGRECRAIDTHTLAIVFVYKLPGGGGFNPPPSEQFVISGSASVEQIETELDRQGNQITVEHPFPGGVVQGGRITPLEARSEISLQQRAQSSDPFSFSETWTNSVNTGGFFYDTNAQPRTWLFARVGFTLLDADTMPFPTWEFRFDLRKNPDGWDPQVVFHDPETGEAPPGLVPDEGFKTIPWHFAIDFATLFGGA